ncbi:hypothetical protein F5Y16DRAFT_376692 [Xylariaceae sp. FL0255]|nr:hypothetical protein F5Y16DRAFT_376692 [Xylariaceae sp. FL0255]
MDPLSLSASIAGLLGAAGQLCSILQFLSSTLNSPSVIRDCRQEITHVEIALRSLGRYLQRLDAINTQRSMLIQLDDLIVTLSDGMMVFSEFENFLTRLETGARARVVIAWVKYSKDIEEHLARIQRLKGSLNLMLSIIQCGTDIEACETSSRLQLLIEEVLKDNRELKKKVRQLEDRFDVQTASTRKPAYHKVQEGYNHDSYSEVSTIRESDYKGLQRHSITLDAVEGISHAFDNILQKSWVYRRNEGNRCDRSVITSDLRSRTWSIFSGISLADISVVSVVAMPITWLDISNGRYYKAGSDLSRDILPTRRFTSNLHYGFLQNSEPIAIQGQISQCITLPEEKAGYGPTDELIYDGGDNRFECKACGATLRSGKAFELHGHCWHLECFRCKTCGTSQNGGPTLFLEEERLLICNDHIYSCTTCGESIGNLAFLAGGDYFCGICFRHSNYSVTEYTRTPINISCKSCHESYKARRQQKKEVNGVVLPRLLFSPFL